MCDAAFRLPESDASKKSQGRCSAASVSSTANSSQRQVTELDSAQILPHAGVPWAFTRPSGQLFLGVLACYDLSHERETFVASLQQPQLTCRGLGGLVRHVRFDKTVVEPEQFTTDSRAYLRMETAYWRLPTSHDVRLC